MKIVSNLNWIAAQFLGDSWFGSVTACVKIKKRLSSEFVGVVKTNHGKFPKTYLLEKMAGWPSVLHPVLEAQYNSISLVAISYKYNSSKT